MPLRGGGGGVGRLMANAIKNFHFDYLHTSLSGLACDALPKIRYIFFQAGAMIGSTLFLTVLEEMYFGQMARLAIDRGAALDLSVD